MASTLKKTYRCTEDVLRDVLDSDFEVDSGSEFGDLSSEEEELINVGLDPEIDIDQASYTSSISLYSYCFLSVNLIDKSVLVFYSLCFLIS